jgi:hypothetical protein
MAVVEHFRADSDALEDTGEQKRDGTKLALKTEPEKERQRQCHCCVLVVQSACDDGRHSSKQRVTMIAVLVGAAPMGWL